MNELWGLSWRNAFLAIPVAAITRLRPSGLRCSSHSAGAPWHSEVAGNSKSSSQKQLSYYYCYVLLLYDPHLYAEHLRRMLGTIWQSGRLRSEVASWSVFDLGIGYCSLGMG